MKKHLKKYVPQPVIGLLKFGFDLAGDFFDLLPVHRNRMVPPHRLRKLVGPSISSGNYTMIGKEYFLYLKEFCALSPDSSILDVGCGCGQMAVELAKYLNKDARYEGFDIIPSLVEWCQKEISPRYPNFQFQVADVFNKTYNPKGKSLAAEYKFPYNDETFDFIFLKSVFTHMLPNDVENYLQEISRVLKKRGRCLITYFLLNDNSLLQIENKKSTLDFKYIFSQYRLIDKLWPEKAVAYDEGHLRSVYRKVKLDLIEPIRYGSWPQDIKRNYLVYQDIILAKK